MVPSTWSLIHDTRGGCPYVPGYYFSFFNNIALILITNYYFSFFNNTALIIFFLFMWQQIEINNMLNLAVANQQKNDLTTQQVLPAIVEGRSWVKLSMETNISSVPNERVTHFGQWQRHQGRQHPQTSNETLWFLSLFEDFKRGKWSKHSIKSIHFKVLYTIYVCTHTHTHKRDVHPNPTCSDRKHHSIYACQWN